VTEQGGHMQKRYLGADELLQDSLELGLRIAASSFHPDLIIGIWRGGTPVAIAVQEVMQFIGINCDHIAIRTSSYNGIGTRGTVTVHGLDYLKQHPRARAILIVDDVFDSGLSIEQVLVEMQQFYGAARPDIRVAVPWYKPGNNRSGREPDYWLHSTADWLVFPHELLGLSDAELLAMKPGLSRFTPRMLALRDNNPGTDDRNN
jgi:hypoxanthine phosphoribosyltransferase